MAHNNLFPFLLLCNSFCFQYPNFLEWESFLKYNTVLKTLQISKMTRERKSEYDYFYGLIYKAFECYLFHIIYFQKILCRNIIHTNLIQTQTFIGVYAFYLHPCCDIWFQYFALKMFRLKQKVKEKCLRLWYWAS